MKLHFRILCGFGNLRQGWFRLFGFGLSWKDTRYVGLTFSERNGYGSGVTIGKWRINFLGRRVG